MSRTILMIGLAFALAGIPGYGADEKSASTSSKSAPAHLTAAEVAAKNAAAKGGLQAWMTVQTLSESGKLTAGGNQRVPQPADIPGSKHLKTMPSSPRLKEEAQLPFVMELERPRKMRFELKFNGTTAVQVYDGTQGWKLRPFLNRNDVESYTQDELRIASMQADLDGPLMNYAAKGAQIELEGEEKVEGQDTYKLKLTTKDNRVTHIWIDAQTFLDTKVEGQPRRLDGKIHPVEVYFRDYRTVNGLKFPFLLETRVLPVQVQGKTVQNSYPPEKIMIEQITVNPKLDAARFTKPQMQVAANHP